ncbi:MAG: thioredoxin [Acidobacteria bacterium]|nr:thioredoxin [Acidobacteriota bacterium]MBI3656415.1 thioredoxin [Acidobacteriota bacterium]
MSGKVMDVTDNSFQNEVLSADIPVLVDFWAAWCAPCRMLAPTVVALADDYAGKVKVAKLNVDENPNTAAQYSIRGIPTLLLFQKGAVVETVVGVKSKEEIVRLLDNYVGKAQTKVK